jgi:hypothetical protein
MNAGKKEPFFQGSLCMMILGEGFILVQYNVKNNIPDELHFKVNLHISSDNFKNIFG